MRLEDVGEFVAWLQLPPAGRSGAVAVLPSAAAQVGAATVNRKLAAVSAFYAHQARNGAEVGDLLAVWKTGGRSSSSSANGCRLSGTCGVAAGGCLRPIRSDIVTPGAVAILSPPCPRGGPPKSPPLVADVPRARSGGWWAHDRPL